MLDLRPVNFYAIQHWFQDFQKRSKIYELPPETSEILGIFDGPLLVGYFIVFGYETGELEINQGYLSKEVRHKDLSKEAMKALEILAKKAGYKKIILASSRTLRAYTQFMSNMGYKPERIIFSKQVE